MPKISEITEAIAIADDDLFVIVNAATGESRRIKKSNVVPLLVAGAGIVIDDTDSQNILISKTPRVIATFDSSSLGGTFSVDVDVYRIGNSGSTFFLPELASCPGKEFTVHCYEAAGTAAILQAYGTDMFPLGYSSISLFPMVNGLTFKLLNTGVEWAILGGTAGWWD